MKITCAKKDDLMRAKYDYDTLTDQYQSKVDEGSDRYEFAMDEVAAYIENEVRTQLGHSSIVDLTINVDTDWNFGDSRTWKVSVNAHDRDRGTNDATSLSWDWSAKLDRNGQVVKDSGSWSGLQAITPEQIDDLEESVRIIKILNNMDWAAILNQAIPKYSDYGDKDAQDALRDRKRNRPDFENQIFEAELEDAIAAGQWIKMEGRPETDYYRGSRRGTYWVKITSMSDKFVKCSIAWETSSGLSNETDERISKQKLYSHIVKPLVTM